jgi:hypothetical protein
MASALDNLEDVVYRNGDYPVQPQYSQNWARGIVGRCKVKKIDPPLSIKRFLDRTAELKGESAERNKIARDFFGTDYNDLTKAKADEVDALHDESWRMKAYLKPGLSFAEARRIRNEALLDEKNLRYPQEVRTALQDFRKGLEKDMEESAKAHRFHYEYSQALRAWNLEAPTQHSINQARR